MVSLKAPLEILKPAQSVKIILRGLTACNLLKPSLKAIKANAHTYIFDLA